MERIDDPVLVVTDEARADLAAIREFDMDMAFGDDENDFSVSFVSPVCVGGEYVYIDGTEYGGVIDSVKASTESDLVTYEGRTWHGILAGKVLCPNKGDDYLTATGDANACIAWIVSRCGLDPLFSAASGPSGLKRVDYRFKRYVDAYAGLRGMLASVGGRLGMRREDGRVLLWAEPSEGHEDAAGELMGFTATRDVRPVNHLVCLGKGELSERVVVHLYADANGKVSKSQTYKGIDERAQTYEMTSSEADDLEKDGRKRLKELQGQGAVTMDVDGDGSWAVGDALTASDSRLGQTVTATIRKKIVKVSGGFLTATYEVADGARATTSRTRTDASEALAAAFSRAEQAQAAAGEAKQTAARKTRNFVGRPVPPYSVGDTWTDTETGVMYVCTTSKEA